MAVIVGIIGLVFRVILVWALAWVAFFLLGKVFTGNFLNLKPLYQRFISVGISFIGWFSIYSEVYLYPQEGLQPWTLEAALAFFAFVPEMYGDPRAITPSGVIRSTLDLIKGMLPEVSEEASQEEPLDTYRAVEITPFQAARGCKVQLLTGSGTKIQLSIPRETRSGTQFRVTGGGRKKDGRVGDHWVTVNIRDDA